eukprot:15344962-Ditylum_brightwellii.AAC.1
MTCDISTLGIKLIDSQQSQIKRGVQTFCNLGIGNHEEEPPQSLNPGPSRDTVISGLVNTQTATSLIGDNKIGRDVCVPLPDRRVQVSFNFVEVRYIESRPENNVGSVVSETAVQQEYIPQNIYTVDEFENRRNALDIQCHEQCTSPSKRMKCRLLSNVRKRR